MFGQTAEALQQVSEKVRRLLSQWADYAVVILGAHLMAVIS